MKKRIKPIIITCSVLIIGILVTVAAVGLNGGFNGLVANNSSENTIDEKTSNELAETNLDDSTPPADTNQTEPLVPVPQISETEKRAREILSSMTLEEKIGQMFIARCPESDAATKAANYHLGGYILFGRDFARLTKDQVIQNITSYQNAVKVPLFIGVDEEGGTVNRVSLNPNLRAVPFWSPQALYKAGGFDLITSDTEEKDTLLHSLGINLNFAPVADISTNPNDFIYPRSFGQDATQTAEYVKTVVSVMKTAKMGSVLKHFPGYGNNTDTHTGVAYDERSYDTFANSDFVPFEAGIDAGANIVLVAHNVVSSIDSTLPASLSPKAHQILRGDLGFQNLIITDDLIMDGVREFGTDEQTAVMAVQAGNDLLCSTNFEVQIPAVIQAVQNDTITEERINESALRILETKIDLGIL